MTLDCKNYYLLNKKKYYLKIKGGKDDKFKEYVPSISSEEIITDETYFNIKNEFTINVIY